MKPCIKLFLPLLITALCLITAGRVAAQTFRTLHTFTATNGIAGTNSDGPLPFGGLILSGNTLYGTAYLGGRLGQGTVFRINTDGTSFTNLHSYIGSEGAYPSAGLILSGNNLYGTTAGGGSSDKGTVFAVSTNGTGFTNLHSFTAGANNDYNNFTNSDGAYPFAGLISFGNILYGTAPDGGSSSVGTVFAVNTDGTGFTNLDNFNSSSDGAHPYAGLILSSNTLYGTAADGGSSGWGTVFAVNTDGLGFTNLHIFTGLSGTSSDGALPYAGLVLSGNTLYGTTAFGGSSGVGTVFKLNTDGTGFTNLHSFTAGAGPYHHLYQ